ncbi:MAG TPA: hypothetical protein VFL98_02890 [Candidatus Paceibacterota bacterium]|nr:hypothetical protein [Candidatus Paceibacterota bacterium]
MRRILALFASAAVAAVAFAGTAAPASANDLAGRVITGIAGAFIGVVADQAFFQPARHATGLILPQQACHYTGYYDRWGHLHQTGRICTQVYQQPQPWRGNGGWHRNGHPWPHDGHMILVPVVPGPQPIPLQQHRCWRMNGHMVCS